MNNTTEAIPLTVMSPLPLENNDAICAPIKTVGQLWNFLEKPPQWLKHIHVIQPRSNSVIAHKNFTCHTIETSCIPKRLDAGLVPRTLVCHDMKNGYLEDKYISSVKEGNGYTFYRWSQIDIFVYFTHHFITIPPLCWINNAHDNGVQIFGTLITEWDEGKKLCGEFLKDSESMKNFVHGLVDLTILCKLDGWLLNFENPFDDTAILKEFVQYLTETIHSKKKDSKIIWYDSVIDDGSLKWQNELNEKNRCFFDICDGIFLNYVWTEEHLATTVKNAEHRIMDVYAGIDVFGRNTYGGGKFNCHVAADKIRQMNLSMAIFAQGWVHESLEREPIDTFFKRFLEKDNSFWRSLWPYLYTHPINKLFDTFFYTGVDKENYNLHKQELQLSRFLHSNKLFNYDYSVPNLKTECNCLQLHLINNHISCILTKNDDTLSYKHCLFQCDISVNSHHILYTFTKKMPDEKNDLLNIILLIQENGSFKKIICNAINNTKALNNMSVINVNVSSNKILSLDDEDNVPEGAALRCYLINFQNPCRILEISGEIVNGNSVILCGIGIKNVNILNNI